MKTKFFLPILVVALASCDGKDEPEYTPADSPTGVASVHFAEAKKTQIVTEDATSFNVMLYRADNESSQPLTVQLLITDDSGLFKFPREVTFAAGKSYTPITVGYNVNDMETNKPYVTYIAINDAALDLYGETTLELIINHEIYTAWAPCGYVKGTKKNGMAVWAEDGAEITSDIRVMERHLPDDENVMEFEAQYYTGDETPDPTVPYDDENWTWVMSFNTSDGGKTVIVPLQPSFLEEGAYDIIDAYTATGNTPGYESTYDKENGYFELVLAYVQGDKLLGPYVNTFRLNGFEDTTDYGLKITNLGQTTVAGAEYAMLGITYNTEELSGVIYTVVETESDAELTAGEVSEIVDIMLDPEQTDLQIESLTKPGNVALSFTQSGTFAAVAAGFNADGALKAVTSLNFTYTLGDTPVAPDETNSPAKKVSAVKFGAKVDNTKPHFNRSMEHTKVFKR